MARKNKVKKSKSPVQTEKKQTAEMREAECSVSAPTGVEMVHSDGVFSCALNCEDVSTPPELADRFEFVRKIGQGAQGNVFEAVRRSDGEHVAIKKLSIDSVKTWKEYELFQREAELLKSLDCAGIAKFYEAEEYLDIDHPAAYIVQEYIDGISLDVYYHKNYRLGIKQIYDVLIQLVELLKILHGHDPQIIHRDIKPSNIVLKPDEGYPSGFQVFLIDFGAVANPQVQGGGSTVAGTFGYMPPEQLMGRAVPASDIYSLGATAVYMFSGVSPADMENRDFHVVFEPYLQSMPIELIRLLGMLLEPRAENRICDHDRLRRLFESLRDEKWELYEKYILGTAQGQAIESEDWNAFEAKLSDVEFLNAPGCMELWQRLPSAVPRKIIRCYKQNYRTGKCDNINTISVKNKSIGFMDEYRAVVRYRAAAGAAASLGIFLLILGWLLVFIQVPLQHGLGIPDALDVYEWVNPLLGGTCGACAAVLYFAFIPALFFLLSKQAERITPLFVVLFRRVFGTVGRPVRSIFQNMGGNTTISASEKRETLQERASMRLRKRRRDAEVQAVFERLLMYGRKTVAVIESVEYVCADVNALYSYDNANSGERGKTYMCTARPRFVIRYRFNPPDDCNKDDIFGTICTFGDPAGHFKAGDSLPVLYLVASKSLVGKRAVVSMPFPMPLEDLSLLDASFEHIDCCEYQ